MKSLMTKVWTWFKALPWYGKLLAPLVLVLMIAFGVLFLVGKLLSGVGDTVALRRLDAVVTENHEEKVDAITGEIEAEEKTVEERKREILAKILEAKIIAKKTKADTIKIKAATTMKELDKLQKELGL